MHNNKISGLSGIGDTRDNGVDRKATNNYTARHYGGVAQLVRAAES